MLSYSQEILHAYWKLKVHNRYIYNGQLPVPTLCHKISRHPPFLFL
jgi:hypothetical protein